MSEVRRVTVELGRRAYEVSVGDGIASRVASLVELPPDAEKAFVITHPGLESLAGPAVGSLQDRLQVEILPFPEGEPSKSLTSVAMLCNALADRRAHRHDLVVTFGGGVVSDVGGFVAATYARGMPLINLPTTLLGQVDAAVGGKTGVNLDQGKNLVGAVYQPIGVVCDVGLLRTCPKEEMRSGLAEVVKYGLIAEPDLLDVVERHSGELIAADPALLVDVVSRSVAIKAEIVAGDEHEQGTRAHLNYGHTFAHAIERLDNYERRHGHAVAVGMMAAAYLARELNRVDEQVVARHRRVLEAVGLPVTADLDLDQLEASWLLDKKYRRGMRFVLLAGLGKPEADVEAPRDALERAIERLRT